jgi:hypothetical protein
MDISSKMDLSSLQYDQGQMLRIASNTPAPTSCSRVWFRRYEYSWVDMLKATGTLLRLELGPKTSSAARRPLLPVLLLLSLLATLHWLLVFVVHRAMSGEHGCLILLAQEIVFNIFDQAAHGKAKQFGTQSNLLRCTLPAWGC